MVRRALDHRKQSELCIASPFATRAIDTDVLCAFNGSRAEAERKAVRTAQGVLEIQVLELLEVKCAEQHVVFAHSLVGEVFAINRGLGECGFHSSESTVDSYGDN